MSAALVALGLLLGTLAVRSRSVDVGPYLGDTAQKRTRRVGRARVGPMAMGTTIGVLYGLAIDPTRAIPLAIVGAMGGHLIARAIRSTTREKRERRLRQELPTVTDTLALHVLAGESVATAIERFVRMSSGVASTELAAVLAADLVLDDALRRAVATTAHPDAGRLYDLLGHAHRTGGALAGPLNALAADFRASLIRDLSAEGGRRALTTYGPILALMVPVTLLFLMYPTLTGLTALSTP